MVDHGFGKHIWVGPAEGSMVRAIGLFVAEITYTCALATVKWSILAFYWRIFSQTSIRIPIWILSAAVVCWAIAVVSVIRRPSSFEYQDVKRVSYSTDCLTDRRQYLSMLSCEGLLGTIQSRQSDDAIRISLWSE